MTIWLQPFPRWLLFFQRLREHLACIIIYWHLAPLWRALTTMVTPSVVLPTLRYSWQEGLRSPEVMRLMLRRQVREILDARRRLGIVTEHLPSQDVASNLVLALTQPALHPLMHKALARIEGRQWRYLTRQRIHPSTLNPTKMAISFPEDYDDQVHYLCDVACAFRHERSARDYPLR